jgi:hypothetical protein
VLSQEEETIRVCFLHLLILDLLKQQTHNLSHDYLIALNTAIFLLLFHIFIVSIYALVVLTLCHHSNHALNPLKEDGVLVRVSHLKGFQKSFDQAE